MTPLPAIWGSNPNSIPLLLLFVLSFFFLCNCLTFDSSQSIIIPGRGDERFAESFGISTCASPDPSLYYYPVIGIVSHPGDGASGRLSNATNASNIPASYVKFVESAGARVIPLIFNEPEEVLLDKLNLVNGVLFTGGWAKEGLYFEIIKKIFQSSYRTGCLIDWNVGQITLQKNDAGDHFPLFAICLGFELVSMIISNDSNICESFSGENQASILQFTDYSVIEGSVFQRFPPELLKKLSTDCLAMQNHGFGLSPKGLHQNDALSSFFKILTTTADDNNKIYVSTAQAYNYPVTCFQWHPEKNIFEWGLPMIPHSEDAVRVTQLVANYFISEARRSSSRPPAKEVLDNVIYNYRPTYCGKAGRGYDEVYIFS